MSGIVSPIPRPILGICALSRKLETRPMLNIVERLKATKDLDLVFIGDDFLFGDVPVEDWPICHVLICFHRSHELLEKCSAYHDLHKMALINDIQQQFNLLNRKVVYETMDRFGIPTSRHLILNRSAGDVVEEHLDRIIINGQVLYKPFVEKPFGGGDHNVYLYYGEEQGFGSRRMFRKKKNRSSDPFPDHHSIRTESNYIYEAFIPGGRDIKVYTCGTDYCHAESRKAPTVDGCVERDVFGKEVRRHVKLTPEEREISKQVVLAFGQNVCGFDMLRVPGTTSAVVIDVNGWSFVKNNRKYYDDCARVIRRMTINLSRERYPDLFYIPNVQCPGNCLIDHEKKHILRAVVGIFRHGDRTPKQKWKKNTRHPEVLDFFERTSRIKTPTPILTALNRDAEPLITDRFAGLNPPPSNQVDPDVPALSRVKHLIGSPELILSNARDNPATRKSLRVSGGISPVCAPSRFEQIDAVVLEPCVTLPGNHLMVDRANSVVNVSGLSLLTSGLVQTAVGPQDLKITLHANPEIIEDLLNVISNIEELQFGRDVIRTYPKGLKVQLRPKYDEDEVIYQVKIIVKWGGELTPYGRVAARNFGANFRTTALPCQSEEQRSAFLSLMRAYSSDEARVRSTAKEFVMGLIGEDTMPDGVLREGDDIDMILNDVSLSKDKLECAKETIKDILSGQSLEQFLDEESGGNQLLIGARNALRLVGDPSVSTMKLYELCNSVVDHIQSLIDANSDRFPYFNEDLDTMLWRWRKMVKELFNKKNQEFDHSKIPDVFDCLRYDLRHNYHILKETDVENLWDLAEILANFVIPQEYGITKEQKLEVSAGICGRLFEKIAINLKMAVESDETLRRVSFFYTSESNMHALRNSLLLSDRLEPNHIVANSLEAIELSYLGHVLIRVFENPFAQRSRDELYVEISASPGCVGDPLRQDSNPVNYPVVLISRIPWADFLEFLYSWAGYIETPPVSRGKYGAEEDLRGLFPNN